MPSKRRDSPQNQDGRPPGAEAEGEPAVALDAARELDGLPSLPPEADLDIRPTGHGTASASSSPASSPEPAPWGQSELAPKQRRRRLGVLAAVVVAFVLGAALWAAGVGRSISGNFEAATNRSDEADLRSAVVVVPPDDYELDLDRCEIDPETGRVDVGGTITLGPDGRGGTYQVVIAFLDGEDDVTTAEAGDDVALLGPGESAPIDALGEVLPEHPDAECLPISVTRLVGSEPAGDGSNPDGGSTGGGS